MNPIARMGRLPFIVLAALLVAAALAGAAEVGAQVETRNSAPGCYYYADANFSGARSSIAEGESSEWVGDNWNDRISSLSCTQGCSLVAFEHIDFGGERARYTGDIPLLGSKWNDRISSLRVRCDRREDYGCAFFEHADNAGQRLDIDEADGVRFVGSFWNDRISAVMCRPGCSAEAFEHAEFAGQSRRFSGETRFVGADWNDRISSIRVICRPR